MSRDEFRRRLEKLKHKMSDPLLKEENFKYIPPPKKGYDYNEFQLKFLK